jgi:hypothetical protein
MAEISPILFILLLTTFLWELLAKEQAEVQEELVIPIVALFVR